MIGIRGISGYLNLAYAKDTTWPHHRAGEKKRKREFRQRGQKRKRKR